METLWTLTVILLALSSGTKGYSGVCTPCSVSCGKGTKACSLDCYEKPCNPSCGPGLDIGIILDKSGSVTLAGLRVAIDFIKSLIGEFNPAPSGDHFGLITYHKNPTMVFKFSDSQYHNEVDLLNKIDDERIDVQAYSHLDRALEMARDQLFTAGGGDRPDKANLLIVLTDGELWYEALNGPPPEEEFKEFLDAISQDLNQKNVYRVVVGFGPEANKPEFVQRREDIAGDNDRVFQITDANALQTLAQAIKTSVCS